MVASSKIKKIPSKKALSIVFIFYNFSFEFFIRIIRNIFFFFNEAITVNPFSSYTFIRIAFYFYKINIGYMTFTETLKLILSVKTLPITISSNKRFSSSLKLVKTYLCKTIGNARYLFL